MISRRLLLVSSLGVVLATGILGCSRRNLDSVGESGTPFIFVLSPSHEAEREKLDRLETFVKNHAGLHLEVRVAESQMKAISGAGTNGADAWLLPLFDYLFCHQEHDIHAGLRLIRESGSSFKGVVVVRADSKVEKLEDIKYKTIAFVDRYSTSGFVYPAQLLREANLKPETVFAGTHQAALDQLRAGKADAAATYAHAVEGDPTLRVIATTNPIPNEPIFFRAGLQEETRNKFIQALIEFSKTPEGAEVLAAIADIKGFEKVDDDAYASAHESIRGADRKVQDLVPKGWWMHHQNRAPLSSYAP